jgi:hypothetical protein
VPFDYRTPTAPQYASPPVMAQPTCWANDRFFNPQTRECRACSYQASCRDAITRNRNAAIAPYVYPGYAPNNYAGPVPAPVSAPMSVPVHVAPAVPQPPTLGRPQVPHAQAGAFPAPQPYQYGWLNDPLYYALFSAPPPMVPQLEGEGFIERMGKNMFRSALSVMTAELFLATRQFIWAPSKSDTDPAPVVVDVKPGG